MYKKEYIGKVENISKKMVSGWAFRIDKKQKKETYLSIFLKNEEDIIIKKIRADNFREDIEEKYKLNYGGFTFNTIGSSYEIIDILFEDSSIQIEKSNTKKDYSLDKINGNLFSGWYSNNNLNTISLIIDDNFKKEYLSNKFRNDLEILEINSGYAAFNIRVPYVKKNSHLKLITQENEVIYENKKFKNNYKVIIVSETEDLNNPSRVYRCNHLSHYFEILKLDSKVVGEKDFYRGDYSNYDCIILARVHINDEKYKILERYKKEFNIKIIYEIDDLVFLPWLNGEVGGVRSKVEKLNDKNLIQLFKNRLKVISLAEHAIVSTKYLNKKMNDIGIKSTIIDNCISEKFLKNKIKARNKKLKLLYMSGSPTHYADFNIIEGILYKFLAENINNAVELNLMGRIDPKSSLNNLPNVNVIPFKKYEHMFEVIDESDICLVPLEKTEFNSSKSFLKYLECGSRCVPVISSNLDEYRAIIKNGVNGFIAENDKEWEYLLNYCLINKDDLHVIGVNAYTNIKNNFVVENNINVCNELIKIIEA